MDKLLDYFSRYGLSGLVIFALFCALWFVFREVRFINEMHAKERERWYEAYKENTEVLRLITGKCVRA